MIKKILIKGAKEHNLKNVSLEIPKDKFVVITGLSGSGKSSLAFDTIYAEGQRRYVESLSAHQKMEQEIFLFIWNTSVQAMDQRRCGSLFLPKSLDDLHCATQSI